MSCEKVRLMVLLPSENVPYPPWYFYLLVPFPIDLSVAGQYLVEFAAGQSLEKRIQPLLKWKMQGEATTQLS